MEKDDWTVIKKFYKEAFGFPESLIELASVMNILLMCVSGSSNETIANIFNFSKEYIDQVIREWFNFGTWTKDLSFSPYHLWKIKGFSLTYDIYDFMKIVRETSSENWTDDDLRTMFRICSQYYRYEDMIKNGWY